MRVVYQAKCKTEWKSLRNVMEIDDQKCDVFKTAKRIVKTK